MDDEKMYVIMKLIEVDSLKTQDERDTIDSFVEVQFGGNSAKTRPVLVSHHRIEWDGMGWL